MAHLVAPNGARIVGTKETILGTALIAVSKTAGGFTFDYDGETTVHWDSQETERMDSQCGTKRVPVFYDVNGDEWGEDQPRVVDDEDEGDDE